MNGLYKEPNKMHLEANQITSSRQPTGLSNLIG